MRIGMGYDVHKLVSGRKLVIGGIEIKHDKGLLGHSDADVLIHAIIDALIGSIGKGSIGDFFPDTDPKYKDASSAGLLSVIVDLINSENYLISNVDSIIVCQEPRMSAYIPAIRENLAKILKIDLSQVNVKAKTEEGLGFTGHKEGISSYAVCIAHKKV